MSTKGVEAGEKKLKRWRTMPGWLVVTCLKSPGDDMNNPMSQSREDYAATCCAIQNLCLSLHASGIGTKWTTGAVNFDERFAKAVGFDGGKEYTVGTIWFGKAASKSVVPGKRLGVDDVLRRVE
jgi:nitroreductase